MRTGSHLNRGQSEPAILQNMYICLIYQQQKTIKQNVKRLQKIKQAGKYIYKVKIQKSQQIHQHIIIK